MEGTVKFFNRTKGFGFVQGDDGKDYFVHSTALAQGVFLRDNDRVSFEPAEGDRGAKAENVQLLEKGSERESEEAPAQETSEESAEEEAQETSEESAEEAPAEEEEAPAEETSEEPAEETPTSEGDEEEKTE